MRIVALTSSIEAWTMCQVIGSRSTAGGAGGTWRPAS
jgi:hypothetical protein